MTITQEQYNAVIAGLRTQLQLHVAFQQEQYENIKTLRELNKLITEDFKCCKGQLDAVRNELEILHHRFNEKINELDELKKK